MGGAHLLLLPIDYAHRFIVFGDETSYDIAIMELGPLVAAQLDAGKVESVPETEWQNPPVIFDFHLLLGTPAETFDTNEFRKRGPNGEDVRRLPTVYDVRRGVLEVAETTRPIDFPRQLMRGSTASWLPSPMASSWRISWALVVARCLDATDGPMVASLTT